MENKFKGIWLERSLWLSRELKAPEKLTLAVIEGLDKGEGCYASNAYLGAILCKDASTVSTTLKGLRNKGYIRIGKTYDRYSPLVTKRLIYSTKKYLKDAQHETFPNSGEPLEVAERPLEIASENFESAKNPLETGKKTLENAPVITKDNKVIEKLIALYTDNPELREALEEFMVIRKTLKAQNTVRGIKKLLADLDALASDDHTKIQIVDQSISNGWKSVFELKTKDKLY